ncbi:MAG: hypothetical protein A3H28_14160 [Acidobacteria bacterium RIFCSPLOWO2_02_FULL_61_28]|nr:MAG: hypothetical protein A3H28_14160 [Acidobacteria bacterium RIFCSPLOWO2_02_FULL_61_28]
MGTKTAASPDLKRLLGQAVEDLSVTDRLQYANTWVAFRVYSPPHKVTRDGVEYVDVRLRRIEAAGHSVEELIAELRRRTLDPMEFEFTPLKPPY